MKKIVTKSICMLIAVIMLLSCNLTAFATSIEDTGRTYEEQNCTLSCISDNSIATFSTGNASEAMNADYSYEFLLDENDSTIAEVTVNVVLNINGLELPVQASGTVNAYPVSDGVVLWEGPLDGYTQVESEEYSVIIGFAMLSNSPTAQMSVTLQGENTEDLMIFAVGGNVITDEVHQALVNQTKIYSLGDNNLDGEEPVVANGARLTNSYVYKTFDFANFEDSDISGYAQRARFYFNEALNTICVSLTSYCDNVNDYYADKTYSVSTCVASFEIGLKRNSDAVASYSWISGIDSFDFDEDYFGGSATLIKPLFEDIMSLLDVPTSTISAVLDGLKGSVEYNSASAKSKSLSVTFGLLENADFDGTGYPGIPVVFQMDRNNNNTYTGNSAYTYTTSIRYRSDIVPEDLSSWYYTYIDAEDATGTGTVTLS